MKELRIDPSIPEVPNNFQGKDLEKVFYLAKGNGITYSDDKSLLQMSNGQHQVGAIWAKNKIDLRKPFTLSTFLYLGDKKEMAADGMTFTLQEEGFDIIGDSGQNLGIYTKERKYVGAVSLEFDTYYNGDGHDGLYSGLKFKGDHIAFTSGDLASSIQFHNGASELAESGDNDYLSNGYWKKLTVTGTPKDNNKTTLSYRLEDLGSKKVYQGNETIGFNSKTHPDLKDRFTGYSVFWGFTSSTGNKWEVSAMSFGSLPQTPTLSVKDVKIYKDEKWDPSQNFISGNDETGQDFKYGDSRLSQENNVDITEAGTYSVIFTYKNGEYITSSTAKVIVLDDKATLQTKDTTLELGDIWHKESNFVSATDSDGNNLEWNESMFPITGEKVDTNIPGTYNLKMTYNYKFDGEEKSISRDYTVTVGPHNPWPNGDTNGWKMFSGEKISLINDPENSIIDTNDVFYSDKQASIYKIFSGDDSLKVGREYRVTVYFKPIDDTISLNTYRVKVALKEDPSSTEYRDLINTTLNTGKPYEKGYYSVTKTFVVGEKEAEPLINIENFQPGYIGSINISEVK